MISLKKRKESKEEAEFKSSLMDNFSIIQKEPTKSKDKSKKSLSKSK